MRILYRKIGIDYLENNRIQIRLITKNPDSFRSRDSNFIDIILLIRRFKLLQETNIVFEEVADVFDSIF